MKKLILAIFLLAGAATVHAASPFQQDTTKHHKMQHKKMQSDSTHHKMKSKMKKDSTGSQK
ncbi:MAG: hypothetical protein ABI813_12425 [Bacteroidota bacterium]